MAKPSAKNNSSAAVPRHLLPRILLAVFAPLVMFMLLEGTLRIMNLGVPSRLYLVDEWQGEKLATENRHFTRKYFGSRLERAPWIQAFPVPKPANEFRIFLLGESAALGDPIPEYGMARIMQALLQDQMKDKQVRVINSAITAINSHVIAEIAREVARFEPDAVILYAGNNEIVGPYGPGTVFTAISKHRSLIRLSTLLRGTRTGQLFAYIADHMAPPQERNWRGMEMFLDRQVERDAPALLVAYQMFAQNLDAILHTLTRRNIPVVLSSVSVNLRDCAPLASPQPGDEANRKYLLAKQRESMGNFEDAKDLYREAMEFDTLRFRADTRINQIIQEYAAMYRDRGVKFVDAEQMIAAHSEHNIPGEEFFYDHVHLNFAGQYVLAWCFVSALTGRDDWLFEREAAERIGWGPWSEYKAWLEMYTRRLLPPFAHQIDREENEARWAGRLIELQKINQTPGFALQEVAAIERALVLQGEDDFELWQKLARAQIGAGNLTEAAGAFSRTADLRPHHADFTLSYAALSAAGRNPDMGLRIMQSHRRWEKQDEDQLFGAMARQLVAWNLVRQAEPLFHRAWMINPENPEALAGLGTSRAAGGRPEEGLAMLKAARQKLKHDDMVAANYGIALYQSGQPQEGIAELESALRMNPENAETRISLALMYRDTQQYDQARELMADALIQRPLDVPLLIDAAELAELQQRWADAVRYFERALRLAPADVKLWYKISRAHAAQGDYTAAAKIVRNSMDSLPDDLATIYLASQILLQTESRAEGVALLKRAIQMDPRQDGWKMNLAWILATHPDEDLRNAQAALDLTGEFSSAVTGWMKMDIQAAALAGLGRNTEAGHKVKLALTAKDIPDEFRRNLENRQQLYLAGKAYIAEWDEFIPR